MRNLTLLTDLYQLMMMNGYFKSGRNETVGVFDLFFRPVQQFNYAVAAGLAQAVEYIESLKFTKADIEYLKSLNVLDENFIQYLQGFSFTGDVYSVEEGEIVFPGEPILTVRAPLCEAQFLETALLNIINHQTLIASKASRIAVAADKAKVIEFGARRAQGPDAGIYGARAAIIGGCQGTSNVLSGKMFDIDVKGTQSHSFIMTYNSELEAFRKFAECYPDNCLLLVDTYDTLKSGVPNALKVFAELREKGRRPIGIRIDSGDLAYLSKKAREMLDEAGFTDAIIFASNDIDENLIEQLKLQGAKIDLYGVGTKLITGAGVSSLGGVYKLSAVEEANGSVRNVMKISDSLFKANNPGFKNLFRIYDKESRMAFADLITLRGEEIPKPLTLTHPVERYKTSVLADYEIRPMLKQIFKAGKRVYKIPPLLESAAFAKAEKARFWEEYKRTAQPHIYKVNLSDGLYALKQKLLNSRTY
ncbi:MAG: nicotinate phosphoribosyltransferase [Firmicutes bacterium]|nr:nicotinate phosphoribosyltransferase [Bacillota bacterium]